MTLAKAADGTANLHIWRDGREYLRQKGPIFLKQWNNLVFAALPGPPLENTRYLDLSVAPIGFPDETFDAVYAYHVFEHLTPAEGERCAHEIFRILKMGGIFRISVPDLESACRDYLDALQAAADNTTRQNVLRYRWAVMAIFEQMVRDRTGGLMLDAIDRREYDDAQMHKMFGDALQPLLNRNRLAGAGGDDGLRSRMVQRWRSSKPFVLLRRIYRGAHDIVGNSREAVTHRLDRRETKENVQWMYDRLSLRLLLERAGFDDVRDMDHGSSSIPGWSGYDFDRSNSGDYPLDPSVYVEGRKLERLRPAR